MLFCLIDGAYVLLNHHGARRHESIKCLSDSELTVLALQVSLSHEFTSANIVNISLTEELLAEAPLGEGAARSLLEDLAYSSEDLKGPLAEVGILVVTENSERHRGVKQHIRDRSFEPQESLWPPP
jgi:hypothetical protein